MKLLFLPDLPDTNDVMACNQIKNMVKNGNMLVLYMDYKELLMIDRVIRKLEDIFGKESFDQNEIIAVAPGCIILELGKASLGVKNIRFMDFAAPGNYCTDFIPLVLEYYKRQKIEIEDVFIVIDEENKQYRNYSYFGRDMPEQIIEGVEMNKALEICAYENDIPYAYLHSNWSNCLSIVEKNFSTTRNKALSLDQEILYTPFFEAVYPDKRFSILFTDRDGTIMTDDDKESYKNFELMKSFLETGNLIFVLPSGNHTKPIFHESASSSALWEMLLPYRNQIIGFPNLCAGLTLGGIKIPVGGYTLYKNSFVEPVVQMFLSKGYDIRKIFCIGDTVQDFPMILETVNLFGGIGYVINRNNGLLERSKSAPNPFTEDNWKYMENHEVPSFSYFMEQFVFPNINDKKQSSKVKK